MIRTDIYTFGFLLLISYIVHINLHRFNATMHYTISYRHNVHIAVNNTVIPPCNTNVSRLVVISIIIGGRISICKIIRVWNNVRSAWAEVACNRATHHRNRDHCEMLQTWALSASGELYFHMLMSIRRSGKIVVRSRYPGGAVLPGIVFEPRFARALRETDSGLPLRESGVVECGEECRDASSRSMTFEGEEPAKDIGCARGDDGDDARKREGTLGYDVL